MTNAEMLNMDYYLLIGFPRGCVRSELERTYYLLYLRHKLETLTSFSKRFKLDDDDQDA